MKLEYREEPGELRNQVFAMLDRTVDLGNVVLPAEAKHWSPRMVLLQSETPELRKERWLQDACSQAPNTKTPRSLLVARTSILLAARTQGSYISERKAYHIHRGYAGAFRLGLHDAPAK